MHRGNEPPVLLVKWYDVTKWLLERADSLPKDQRFVFGVASIPVCNGRGARRRLRRGHSGSEGDLHTMLETTRTPLMLILNHVQAPHNLGACLRLRPVHTLPSHRRAAPSLPRLG